MNATAAAATRSHSRLLLVSFLGALALLAFWFIRRSALPYFELSEAHYGPYFWPRRWWLVLHIAGGVTALTVGLVQLWLGLSNRIAALHRALGKLYVAVIAIGSMGGFYLALTIPGNAPYAAGLFFLCVAWVITTSMAVFAIRRRKVLQHREWMMRSYAVTFGVRDVPLRRGRADVAGPAARRGAGGHGVGMLGAAALVARTAASVSQVDVPAGTFLAF